MTAGKDLGEAGVERVSASTDSCLRIWLLPSSFAPHRGGVEELTLKLARELQARGHEVLVVTNRWPEDLPESDVVEGINCARVRFHLPGRHPRSWLPYLRTQGQVRESLRAMGPAPDVLHVICASSQLAPVRRLAESTSAAVVITTQGETEMDAQQIYRVNPWLRRQLRTAGRRADALSACSSWTRSMTARVAPAFTDARVILNGVEAADWPAMPEVAAPVILAWGRHVPQKGLDLLLQAFGEVVRTRPAAELLIGGDGPESASLRALADDRVRFLGPLDRAGVRQALSQARVVAVPSRIEPFGIVAVEALAAGRGLVYSSHGGLGEAAGGLGRPADPYDPVEFARALLCELDAPTSAQDGRARAAELDWSHLASEYEELYRDALTAARRRAARD